MTENGWEEGFTVREIEIPILKNSAIALCASRGRMLRNAGTGGCLQAARFSEFQFEEVLRDEVEIAKVDQFLSDAEINPFSNGVAQMLEAERVYVTTAALKSNQFTVTAKESESFAFLLDQDLSNVDIEFAPNAAWRTRMISMAELEDKVELLRFPREFPGSG